jgi:hypothetical protein
MVGALRVHPQTFELLDEAELFRIASNIQVIRDHEFGHCNDQLCQRQRTDIGVLNVEANS